MIIRIYAGDDGESHFEDLTADQFADIANDVGPGDITVGQRPAGWWQDYHTAPRHQYVVFMSGGAEIEVASGAKRQFGPATCWSPKTSPVMGTSSATLARNLGCRWPCL